MCFTWDESPIQGKIFAQICASLGVLPKGLGTLLHFHIPSVEWHCERLTCDRKLEKCFVRALVVWKLDQRFVPHQFTFWISRF